MTRREGMLIDQLVVTCPPHYFKLEAPHGQRTVTGICVRCGAVREFKAGWDEAVDPYIARHAARVEKVQCVRLNDFGMHVISGGEEEPK